MRAVVSLLSIALTAAAPASHGGGSSHALVVAQDDMLPPGRPSLATTVPLMRKVATKEASLDAAGAQTTTAALPPYEAPIYDVAAAAIEAARNDAAVVKVKAALAAAAYNLTPEEQECLDRRDMHGSIDGLMVVDGFPVNDVNPWLDGGGGGLAKSMVPHAAQIGSLGFLDAGRCFVRLDIHLAAAHWQSGEALEKAPMQEVAKLILSMTFSTEVLAFGKLAIAALREEAERQAAPSRLEEMGLDYHLRKPTYAFKTENVVVVTWPHPQNLLPGWAGVISATLYGRMWDAFAADWRARDGAATAVAAAPSLAQWVERQADGLTEGQRPFERATQLRAAEQRAGTIVPFLELPWACRNFLEAHNLGEERWAPSAAAAWGYESPLNAIVTLNGQAGGMELARLGRLLTDGTDREGESAYAIQGGEESARLGQLLTDGTDREGESAYAIQGGEESARLGLLRNVGTADAGLSAGHQDMGRAHAGTGIGGAKYVMIDDDVYFYTVSHPAAAFAITKMFNHLQPPPKHADILVFLQARVNGVSRRPNGVVHGRVQHTGSSPTARPLDRDGNLKSDYKAWMEATDDSKYKRKLEDQAKAYKKTALQQPKKPKVAPQPTKKPPKQAKQAAKAAKPIKPAAKVRNTAYSGDDDDFQ